MKQLTKWKWMEVSIGCCFFVNVVCIHKKTQGKKEARKVRFLTEKGKRNEKQEPSLCTQYMGRALLARISKFTSIGLDFIKSTATSQNAK